MTATIQTSFLNFSSSSQLLNIVALGDSITEGYPDFGVYAYTTRLAVLRPTANIVNAGLSGATYTDVANTLIPTYIAGHLDPSRFNICLLMCGINDILEFGQSAAATLAAASTNIATIKGYGFKVMVSSLLPYNFSSNQSVRTAFNAGIASQGADYFTNIGAESYYNPANGAVYVDELHLTHAGYSALGDSWHSALIGIGQ